MKRTKLFAALCLVAAASSAMAGSRLRGNPDTISMSAIDTISNGQPALNIKVGALGYAGIGYDFGPGATSYQNAQNSGVWAMPSFSPATVTYHAPAQALAQLNTVGATLGSSYALAICDGQQLPATAAQIISQAVPFFAAQMPQQTASLTSFMTRYGVPSGLYSYNTTVKVPGDLNAAVTTTATPPSNPSTNVIQPTVGTSYAAVGGGYYEWDDSGSGTLCTGGGTDRDSCYIIYTPIQDAILTLTNGLWSLSTGTLPPGSSGGGASSGGTSPGQYLACDPTKIPMTTETLTFAAYVDQSGKTMYGTPSLVNGSPTLLSVTYIPLAVSTGLPQTWQYPGAGTLSYQVVDGQGNAVGSAVTIDTKGAYDPPQGDGPQDAGMACLANSTGAGCPQGYPDVMQILGSTGASIAAVNYVAPIAPAYTTVGTTTAGGTAAADQVAQFVGSVTQRTIAYPTCGNASYQNQGTYQLVLEEDANRYMVNPDGSYNFVNTASAQTRTASTGYNWQYPVTPAQYSSLTGQIIDPLAGQSLYALSDLPGVQAVPLSSSGTPPPSAYYEFSYNGSPAWCDVNNSQIDVASCPGSVTPAYDATANQIFCGGAVAATTAIPW